MRNVAHRFEVALLLWLSLTLSAPAQSQDPVPNAGFENWTGSNPDGWSTFNNINEKPVTQSDDGHSGSFAVRGEVVQSNDGVRSPSIVTGSFLDPEFGVSQRFQGLSFYLKYFPVNNDSLTVRVSMYKGGPKIGDGQISFKEAVSTYTQFEIPINYTSSDDPDGAAIFVELRRAGNGSPTLGSFYLLDDFEFQLSTTSVEVASGQHPRGFSLEQNYPNPFNPETIIHFSIPYPDEVTLSIYDLSGRLVRTLHSGATPSGDHYVRWNATDDRGVGLATGVYFYHLKTAGFVMSKKLLFVK